MKGSVLLATLGILVAVSSPGFGGEIHDAAYSGQLGRLRELVTDSPELVHAPDQAGRTALHFAAEGGRREVAEFLLDEGAAVDRRDREGRTALHEAAKGGHEGVAALLLARGADADAASRAGETPLHAAARGGHKGVVELLLDEDVRVSAQDGKGLAPLHVAAQRGHKEVVELLLAEGARVDVQTAGLTPGWTPLHFAAQGAEAGGRTRSGDTALDLATSGGHKGIVELLKRRARRKQR